MKIELTDEERFLICVPLKSQTKIAEKMGWRYKGENVWLSLSNIENKLKCQEVV